MLPTTYSTTRALSMTLSTALALGAAGCNGAFVGNIVVLGLTLGVFFGTLGLGRNRVSPAPQPTADQSQSDI